MLYKAYIVKDILLKISLTKSRKEYSLVFLNQEAKSMADLHVGIMPRERFQQRALDIAGGRVKPGRGEPKIWFSSMKSFSEVLSDNNVRLLKMIAEQKPSSIKELEKLSGRRSSNLSRTLKTFERYGLVDLQKVPGSRAILPVAKATGVRLSCDFASY